MLDLVLTLGHNSSAIAIKDGIILAGYEEERLTKVKSDSSYPINAIKLLQSMYGEKFDTVFVSHWFADTLIRKCKYADVVHLKSIADRVKSVSKEFSHHDAHNLSALTFTKFRDWDYDHYYSMVVDGFGSFGESLSVYKCNGRGGSTCMLRAFGYDKSLGLLFQYTTAFLGMKMHSDEYKLLGYEAHANELDAEIREFILQSAHEMAKKYVDNIFDQKLVNMDKDPIVNIEALGVTKNAIFNFYEQLCHELELENVSNRNTRIAISLFVQTVVETTIIAVISKYSPKHLVVSGGVFMNVKLNRALTKAIPGKVSIMPLAGDQGAGLGVYQHYRRDLQWPHDLYWGKRTLKADDFEGVEGITVFVRQEDFENAIIDELKDSGRVNIVHGNMEFGARALCNTTTLGMPFSEITEDINRLNDRTTIMPMAPVMTPYMAHNLLDADALTATHISEEYMITAMDVYPDTVDVMPGASHFYPGFDDIDITCRPQVLYNYKHPVYKVLDAIGHPLINTSFNYHGVPIVFDAPSIIHSHKMQNENGSIKTFILENDND